MEPSPFGRGIFSWLESVLRSNETLVLALPKGRILGEVMPLRPPRRHRGRARIRRRGFASAALRNQPSRPRCHPRAQLRRRDVRRLRRGASRRRRQRRADGIRLSRDLCAARPRDRPLPARRRGAGGWRRARGSVALEPCPGGDQIPGDHPPPLRRARRPGGVHQAQRRDGAGADRSASVATSSISCRPARRCRPTASSRSSASPRSARASSSTAPR